VRGRHEHDPVHHHRRYFQRFGISRMEDPLRAQLFHISRSDLVQTRIPPPRVIPIVGRPVRTGRSYGELRMRNVNRRTRRGIFYSLRVCGAIQSQSKKKHRRHRNKPPPVHVPAPDSSANSSRTPCSRPRKSTKWSTTRVAPFEGWILSLSLIDSCGVTLFNFISEICLPLLSKNLATIFPEKNTPNVPVILFEPASLETLKCSATTPAFVTPRNSLPTRVGNHSVSIAYVSPGCKRTIGLLISASM